MCIDYYSCIFQLFPKTGRHQIHFLHFPVGASDGDVFLCDRCEEGGILAVHDSPSMETKFGFSSDCERNVTLHTKEY